MKNILRSVIAALFVTLTLGALLGTQAFAQKTEEIVRLKTRNNVEQPYWLIPVSYTHLDVYKRQGC